jgi:hypothetical protein
MYPYSLIAAVKAVLVAVAVVLGMATGAGAGGGSRLNWLRMVGQKRTYRKPWLRMVGQKRSYSAARPAAANDGRRVVWTYTDDRRVCSRAAGNSLGPVF